MGDLVAEFKDAAVFGRLPDDMSISERVTQNQSLLVAGLRDALADIATLTIKVADLQRQLANVTSTPQHLKAASLPPTPATLLMPSPGLVSSSLCSSAHSTTPDQRSVVCSTELLAATAGILHPPPLIQLDIRPVAPLQGQGGIAAKKPKTTSVAMCQTPGSWLLYDRHRRSLQRPPRQQQQPPASRPTSPPSPVKQLFDSPHMRAARGLQRNQIRPPERPPPPRPVSAAQCSSTASSEYESAPEVPDQPIKQSATAPIDHQAVMRQVQARRLASAQQDSKILVRSHFNMWRAVLRAARSYRPANNAASVYSDSWRCRHRRGGHRQHRQQQQHRQYHGQHHTRLQSTEPVRFNQDFPHYNVRGVCIRCGSGWLPGYWRRQARYGPPSNRPYDPLADKIICDSCRSAHPLGPFCFPEYYTYVTDDAVRRVQAEADTAMQSSC